MRTGLCRAAGALLAGALMTGAAAGGVAHAQTGPASARNVVLCHEEASPCETSHRYKSGGDEHPVVVLVTDRSGAPVADVLVEVREEGVGRFTTGGDSVVLTTASDGTATAVVAADVAGSSRLTAEISPPGTANGLRGPAPDDDACEQPGGNCVSAPLVVDWSVPPPTECSDGVDNNSDGTVDMDDPFCQSPDDPSEGHFDPVSDIRVKRGVTLSFGEWTRDRVVLFGRVKNVTDGPPECFAQAPVRILRRSGGRWVPQATVTTSGEGWYVVTLPDRPGRYRASALRFEPGMVDGSYVTCIRAHHGKRRQGRA